MDRDEFNKLDMDQQVEYVNRRLKDGLTLRDVIERELNLTRSTMRARFAKKGYIYNKKENKYFRDFSIKVEEKKTKSNTEGNVKSNTKSNISNIDKKTIKMNNIEKSNIKRNTNYNTESNIGNMEINPVQVKALMELIERKDEILNLLDNKDLIFKPDVSKEIDIAELEGKLTVKTVKIYDDILDKFNKFRKKHRDLKQQDIVNLALKEFIEKYD